MDFLIMIVAAVIVFGKLAAKSEGEGNKKRTQNVGPTAEEWAERLRQSAAGGEVSDKLNSAVNALKKSPRRPSGRDIEAEQARRNAAEPTPPNAITARSAGRRPAASRRTPCASTPPASTAARAVSRA